MLVKKLLWPTLKRFKGLFISMVVVSMLSISLMVCLLSSITNLSNSLQAYKEQYGSANGIITTNVVSREQVDALLPVEGVENIDYRITFPAYVKLSTGKVNTGRIYSYRDNDSIYKRYVVESNRIEGEPNLSVEYKFAKNNNIKVGDKLNIGYFNTYLDFNVGEIVKTPESMYVRANDAIWSDAKSFGYIYVDEQSFDIILRRIGELIQDKITADPEFKAYYDKAVMFLGGDLPDFTSSLSGLASNFCNQILIKAEEGYTEELVLNNVLNKMNSEEFNIKEQKVGSNIASNIYINNSIRQLKIATAFVPAFFYLVTLFVIVLFINQIIKAMTSDIGIMMSVGISNKSIISIFSAFTLLMSVASCLLGAGLGYGLLRYICDLYVNTFSLAFISYNFDPWVMSLSILTTIILGQIAVLISSSLIFKITPKDAMVSNEAKRKAISPKTEAFLNKLPMHTKLSINSMIQNKRRFLISVFAIFSTFVMIILTCNFMVSTNALVKQTTIDKLPFTCQTYLTKKDDENIKDELNNLSYIQKVEEIYYTYTYISKGDQSYPFETWGIDVDHSELVYIPNNRDRGITNIKDKGIVLDKSTADRLKVKVGDSVTINQKEVIITDISKQYGRFIEYMSKAQFDELGLQYVTSFLVNTDDVDTYMADFSNNHSDSITVISSNLADSFSSLFKSINVIIYILIFFSLVMGFVILVIMSQNSLMEQKKQMSILRAIGFRIIDISRLWSLQSVSQLIFSTLFAIPSGALTSYILFTMASGVAQTYPLIFNIWVYLLSFGFILLVIVSAHMISMKTIDSWNLADNTRTRE